MHLAHLWQYPVKSMIGGEVASARLGGEGMVGDRTWATRDEQRGGIRGAKKIGGLMRCAARYVDAEPQPGSTVETRWSQASPPGRSRLEATTSSGEARASAIATQAIVHAPPAAGGRAAGVGTAAASIMGRSVSIAIRGLTPRERCL